jgi:hypothetical protein
MHHTDSTPSRSPEVPKRRDDERGEGVISAAIAVLVMAFLGVAMWVAFSATFKQTARNVNNQVNCIGSTQTASC